MKLYKHKQQNLIMKTNSRHESGNGITREIQIELKQNEIFRKSNMNLRGKFHQGNTREERESQAFKTRENKQITHTNKMLNVKVNSSQNYHEWRNYEKTKYMNNRDRESRRKPAQSHRKYFQQS